MSKTSYLAFVQSAPGLESLLREEMTSLLGPGIRATDQSGGVSARLDGRQLFQLCLATRLAESVRVRLKSFIARDFSALEEGLSRLPWSAYLAPHSEVDVRVVCHRSRLWHTGAVIERVVGLLERRAGARAGKAEDGALQVHVRITGDAVQASVDAGGYRLHRRGIRQFSTEASVRETLAAATVSQVLSREPSPSAHLWDPFCGAGTLGLEALLLSRGILPGGFRSFAFQQWPTHEEGAFQEVKANLAQKVAEAAPHPDLRVVLSDRDPRAIEAAEKNVASADLRELAEFRVGSVKEVAASIPEGALVATNPPYGKRIREGGAIAELLEVLAARPDLRPVALLVGGAARSRVPVHFRAALRSRSGGENVSVRVLDRGQSPL